VRAFYLNKRHRGWINYCVFWFHAIIIDEIQAEDKHKKAPGWGLKRSRNQSNMWLIPGFGGRSWRHHS
jgi:hypothetical protein